MRDAEQEQVVRLQCIDVRYGEETRIEVSHRAWNHAEIDAVRYRDPDLRGSNDQDDNPGVAICVILLVALACEVEFV